MRRAFNDTLLKLASGNDRVIFLTGDLGFQVFDEFRQRFGPRYVNVGVAEAQLMCAAAGLAIEGWRPLAYSIASFATARPYEQIRISIGYPRLPVVIVGAGGGYTYSNSGVTHQSPDDLGLMSLIPGMTVVAPGCPDELCQLMPQLFTLLGPSYLRIGRFGEANYRADDPAVLGRIRLLRSGERIAVIATGDIAPVVLEAVDRLNREGITPLMYQCHTVKPIDESRLDELAGRVRTIIIVEEHLPTGGLFSAVAGWRAGRASGPDLVRLGPPDAFMLGNPDRDELRRRIGCNAETIYAVCLRLWEQGKT
ncbi:MAG: transketolase C-terminal domain-containing protein [Kiritimatiellia bacterium]|nr:transketolase C-terminal domain-containing protein [Kiritimatiellia bacterium]